MTPHASRGIALADLDNDGSMEIVVSDNGRGIDPAFLPHVWERFRQADGSTSRSKCGLGLGLAIVRHIVEMHGGTVTVFSEGDGRGSEFTVLLPGLRSGVTPEIALDALTRFEGVKRRLELRGTVRGVAVYDDFAHHPTAIDTTLDGARKKLGERRLWAIIEPRSNTMRMGSHKDGLAHSARVADQVIWYQPAGLDWDLSPVIAAAPNPSQVLSSLDEIIARIVQEARDGDAVVIMSNGGFGGLHQKLLAALQG